MNLLDYQDKLVYAGLKNGLRIVAILRAHLEADSYEFSLQGLGRFKQDGRSLVAGIGNIVKIEAAKLFDINGWLTGTPQDSDYDRLGRILIRYDSQTIKYSLEVEDYLQNFQGCLLWKHTAQWDEEEAQKRASLQVKLRQAKEVVEQLEAELASI